MPRGFHTNNTVILCNGIFYKFSNKVWKPDSRVFDVEGFHDNVSRVVGDDDLMRAFGNVNAYKEHKEYLQGKCV